MEFDYVTGLRQQDEQSHAWLLQGDIIVDITADQLDDIVFPVIITSDNSWHQQFKEIDRAAAEYDEEDHTRAGLDEVYERVMEKITGE